MIENDEQLQQGYEALGDLYRVLASYRAKVLPVNPGTYAVIAQGPLEEIRKIQAGIDGYLGLQEPLAPVGESVARGPASTFRETPPAFGASNDSK